LQLISDKIQIIRFYLSLVNLGQLHTEKARSNYLLQGNNKSMVIFVLKRQKVVR
jgi:hypothetical protein